MPYKDDDARRAYFREYMRKRRAATPRKPRRQQSNTAVDIHRRIDRSNQDGCWEWTAGTTPRGYGKAKLNGRTILVHRWVWEQEHPGELLTKRDFVCHTCDNPPCARSSHLVKADHDWNMADMAVKGRAASGAKQGSAKLSDELVTALRSEYAAGGVKQVELAARYGISQSQVSNIVLGRKWATRTT